jgi:hypothetical protein
MAEAQRKPPVRNQGERLIEQLREVTETVRRGGFTEQQREQVRQILQELNQLMQQMQTTQPVRQTQTSPQSRTAPAPRRIEQFVYDVALGGRTYRIAMAEPLPTLRGGGVDVAAAERKLHDLLLNNQLVRHENPRDPTSPVVTLAQVTMPGATQADTRFNAGTPSQRLDLFRDAYLGLTFRDGRYVESTAVRIAEAPHASETRRN